jgi:hypothetical protein
MDPYLEGDLWTTFHSQLAAEVARQLAPKLAPKYVALTEKRYLLDSGDDFEVLVQGRYPDVGIVETTRKGRSSKAATGLSAPIEIATVMAAPVPHFWVEVRDARRRRLVTLIELLSPANKRGRTRKQYLRKRNRVLASAVHLLEIDLVRQGKRVPMREPLPAGAYFVLLSRAARRPMTGVWPISLQEPLPTVPVPLLEKDPDVSLDLQAAFTQVYDLCRYDLILDYRQAPESRCQRHLPAGCAGR